MRKSTLVKVFSISALALHLNCQSYGEIKVRKDSFKNSKVVSITLDHKSEESFGLFGTNVPIEITYVKEIKTGDKPSIEMKLIIPASATSELKSQAFIKADRQKFEVAIEGINKTSATHSDTTNTRDAKGVITDTKTQTSTQYAAMGTIKVSYDVWKQMMSAQKVGYRLYVDQEALSFLVSEEWFEKLKEFDAQ